MIIWLSLFIAAGVYVGLIAGMITRFEGLLHFDITQARRRLFSAIVLLLLSGVGWSIVNRLNVPTRTVLTGSHELHGELQGVSGPQTADINPEDASVFTEVHSIKIDPGRIDQPVTITYSWRPPRAVITYPKEAAAFLTGVGAKDMKTTGMPPCPEAVKGRVSEVSSCAHRDAKGNFVFAWTLSSIADSQTVKAMVRLGATAVDGTFETQICHREADTKVCSEKSSVTSFSPAGDGNSISVLYGQETVEVHNGDTVTSKDGAVTVDGANGTVALTTVVKDSVQMTRAQATLLGFFATALGAILGNGVLFAVLGRWRPVITTPPPARVRAPTPRPRH